MKSVMQIRPYTPKDYPQVKAVYQSEGAWFREGIDDEKQLNKKIAQDPHSILVAEQDGKIVGTISIINDYRMAFFVRLAVLPRERKKGIGTQLLQVGEKILREKGLTFVSILVSENQEHLYDYYARRGYTKGMLHQWMLKKLQ